MSTEPERKPEESCIEHAKKQNIKITEEKKSLFNVNIKNQNNKNNIYLSKITVLFYLLFH
jgi:hypothetical protein